MEADVQRNSGKLSQDCIKTIGIEDIEKLAEEQKQNDPEIKMTDARANGLLTLKRSPARMDEYGHIWYYKTMLRNVSKITEAIFCSDVCYLLAI